MAYFVVSSPGFGPGPRPSQSRVRSTTLRGRWQCLSCQYPAEDSNLVRELRRLPCVPAHPQGDLHENSNRLSTRRSPRALMSRPGFEPGPGPSEGPNAFRYTIETINQLEREESNPVKRFW